MFDYAAAECDAGPAATGAAAGLAGMRCGVMALFASCPASLSHKASTQSFIAT